MFIKHKAVTNVRKKKNELKNQIKWWWWSLVNRYETEFHFIIINGHDFVAYMTKKNSLSLTNRKSINLKLWRERERNKKGEFHFLFSKMIITTNHERILSFFVILYLLLIRSSQNFQDSQKISNIQFSILLPFYKTNSSYYFFFFCQKR